MALKYVKVKEYLQEQALHPESAARMPTIRELMKQFGMSLATINRALAELEHEGTIIRRQGARIVPAGKVRSVRQISGNTKRRLKRVLLAYVDYPAEVIWKSIWTVEQYCRQNKVELVVCKRFQDTPLEEIIRYAGKQRKLDGMLLINSADRISDGNMALLGTLPFPVVLLRSIFLYPQLPENVFVQCSDYESDTKALTECLIENGHTRIGYVRNGPQSDASKLHMKGFSAALKEHGIEPNPSYEFHSAIKSWENALSSAQTVVLRNIDTIRKERLTALVFDSSEGALAAIRPLQEHGFRVPEDISIAGDNELSFYDYLPIAPAVTKTRLPDMIAAAIGTIKDFSKSHREDHLKFFPSELIPHNGIYKIHKK